MKTPEQLKGTSVYADCFDIVLNKKMQMVSGN